MEIPQWLSTPSPAEVSGALWSTMIATILIRMELIMILAKIAGMPVPSPREAWDIATDWLDKYLPTADQTFRVSLNGAKESVIARMVERGM